jgi:hypothetical protein
MRIKIFSMFFLFLFISFPIFADGITQNIFI